MQEETKWVLLGVVAIIAIITMVFMYKITITGKYNGIYYSTPEEACGLFTHMCEDGLPPVPTGNVDYDGQLVECRCQTNPYHTGWRSMKATPWKR